MNKATLLIPILAFTSTIWAHHPAPEEVTEFIEEQLIAVDSLHLLSDEDDPSSVSDIVSLDMEDVDVVATSAPLDDQEVTDAVDSILNELDQANTVCDVSYLITLDADGYYVVTVNVDYCDL